MIEKNFDPAAIEAKWYAHWEATGAFRPHRPDAEPFTIVIPPPNVTGSLHIGHALDNTLQDILIRYQRLRGKDALWVVGTDHAGIATQMVVERLLDAEGTKRTDLGREAFLDRVWRWKAESGDTITRQLRRLGASCDWANERFTMDEGFSAAVRKVFVQLYNEGLIYRAKRLVNWDPKLRTAISDLEVETREVAGQLVHFRYPLADGSGHITVATTRPETMLGDTGIAVNPTDDRYTALVGRVVRHPFDGREFPIVADDWADPEFGSGAVKITPGHDFNDFEVGKRNGLAVMNILEADATIGDEHHGDYRGITVNAAREKIIADLDAAGLLDRIEDRTIQMPFGDRSGVVIEPWLTDQWYVNAAQLAEAPMAAVRSGETRFVPETWSKTFFQWMENIQPWCVSRQLWWGHRIPAWYADHDGKSFVAETEEAARNLAAAFYAVPIDSVRIINKDDEPSDFELGLSPSLIDYLKSGPNPFDYSNGKPGAVKGVELVRDQDVLDTLFSSALWPFATLGWPERQSTHAELVEASASVFVSTENMSTLRQAQHEGKDQREGSLLNKHYPNSVLVTGFDIIFFWVARMQMMGHHIMGEAPFPTVYCHGLVRDAKGQKMSKSKGNAVDPLGLIDNYGADALRFFMAAMETQGRDIKMSEARVEGYRNFATKLWNAARFAQANGIGGSTHLDPPRAHETVNAWIIAETVATITAVELALADYRFDAAASAIYQFVWSRFCDWYLELIKPVLSTAEGPILAEPGPAADETRAVAGWVLDQILVLLHPFMPFITEELWHALAPRPHDLILAQWPRADARALDPDAPRAIDFLIRLIEATRSARNELNVPHGANLPLHIAEASPQAQAWLATAAPALARMARVSHLSFDPAPPGGAAQIILAEATAVIPLAGVIDLAAERARLEKTRDTAVKEAATLTARLANQGFLAKAKPEAVEEAREKLTTFTAEADRLTAALARLG